MVSKVGDEKVDQKSRVFKSKFGGLLDSKLVLRSILANTGLSRPKTKSQGLEDGSEDSD